MSKTLANGHKNFARRITPIAYFIPDPNDTGCGPQGGPSPGPGCTFGNTGRDGHTVNAIHTNNVELDDRGLIYIADRAGTGMHVIRLTGEAAEVTVAFGLGGPDFH